MKKIVVAVVCAMFFITPSFAEADTTLASILSPYGQGDTNEPEEDEEEDDDRNNDDDDRDDWYESRRYRGYSREARELIEELNDEDPLEDITIPVLGITPARISDSWGDARSSGRTHEGTDIMAPKGTFVMSPGDAVVTSIGYGDNGGNYVYTLNAGGERYYYAHLDTVDPRMKTGVILEKGDIIGRVGNTGNASGGAPHLHFGIYDRGAENPYPRLTKSFTLKELLTSLTRHLGYLQDMRD